MNAKEKFAAEFNSLKQSEKALVANYFNMCNLYPGFDAAFDAWNCKNGGYTLEEFFEFIDNYEARSMSGGSSGQSMLN